MSTDLENIMTKLNELSATVHDIKHEISLALDALKGTDSVKAQALAEHTKHLLEDELTKEPYAKGGTSAGYGFLHPSEVRLKGEGIVVYKEVHHVPDRELERKVQKIKRQNGGDYTHYQNASAFDKNKPRTFWQKIKKLFSELT